MDIDRGSFLLEIWQEREPITSLPTVLGLLSLSQLVITKLSDAKPSTYDIRIVSSKLQTDSLMQSLVPTILGLLALKCLYGDTLRILAPTISGLLALECLQLYWFCTYMHR